MYNLPAVQITMFHAKAATVMHHSDLSRWKHEHRYTTGSPIGESRTLLITGLTAAMMLLQIVDGHFLHSMALLTGW